MAWTNKLCLALAVSAVSLIHQLIFPAGWLSTAFLALGFWIVRTIYVSARQSEHYADTFLA